MSFSPVTDAVFAVPIVANYTVSTKHLANATQSTGVNIGDLVEQGVTINLTDISGVPGVDSPYIFTVNDGDTIFLTAAFDNIVNAITTRVQLRDSEDNIIADNQGSEAEQYAYTQLVSSGLAPGAGNYSVTITPPPDEEAPDITLTVLPQQGTSLWVESELTGGSPNEFYNFSLSAGNDLKLAFDALDKDSAFRVQLYSSAGFLIADSLGTESQRNAYAELTSATGLVVTIGDYAVKVSYADSTATDNSYRYSFQLYSGTNYAVVTTTTAAALPNDNSAAASVTATSDSKLFSRGDFHTIKETALSGVNIGWIQEDKSALTVFSRLTSFNPTQYYNFTLQIGDNLKLGFANTTDAKKTLHVQVLDSSGTKIVADNQGTDVQRAAYKKLTSTTGLDAKEGQYVIKVTYVGSSNGARDQDYNFQVYSGTQYASVYKTTVSAQTYKNAFLSGQIGTGFNAKLAAASYLTSAAADGFADPFANSSNATDIIGALTKTV